MSNIKKHLMLDLETLDKTSNAVIVSIALVPFYTYSDRKGYVDTEKMFTYNISPKSCTDLGMTISADTMLWWMERADIAKKSWMLEPNDLSWVLWELYAYVKYVFPLNSLYPLHDVYLWSHGSNFDIPILQNAIEKINLISKDNSSKMKLFWKYSNVLDTRTIFNLAGIDFNKDYKKENTHTALQDALNQAQAVVDCYVKIHNLA